MTFCFGLVRWLVLVLALPWAVGAELALAQNDEPVPGQATKTEVVQEVESGRESGSESASETEDLTQVPEGGSAELLKFLEKILQAPPASPKDILQRRDAFKAACEKILKLDEKTPKSKAATTARESLFQIRLLEFRGAEDEAASLVDDLNSHFALKGDALDELDAYLATTTGLMIEQSGQSKLATKACRSFAKAIAGAKNKKVAATSAKLEGFVRRMNLLGSKVDIKGTTVDGNKFDLKSYRGKFVLVHFWSTSCVVCILEMPNVQRYYDRYRKRGFEVVGISVDTDRRTLERFLGNRKVPGITLFEDNGLAGNSNADRYGVVKTPFVILLDREGKAVSMEAHGIELGRLLQKHLGPIDAARDGAAKEGEAKNNQ